MSTEVLTSVPGNIWKVLVEVGDELSEGDVLFIMEVMKSEVNHNAPISGTVIEVNISNDQEGVSPGTVAIVIERVKTLFYIMAPPLHSEENVKLLLYY